MKINFLILTPDICNEDEKTLSHIHPRWNFNFNFSIYYEYDKPPYSHRPLPNRNGKSNPNRWTTWVGYFKNNFVSKPTYDAKYVVRR